MESNRTFRTFEVISGNTTLIREIIEFYNKDYGTDFSVVDFDNRDGVIFAIIKSSNASDSDIFQLGNFFGMEVQIKRSKKEINW